MKFKNPCLLFYITIMLMCAITVGHICLYFVGNSTGILSFNGLLFLVLTLEYLRSNIISKTTCCSSRQISIEQKEDNISYNLCMIIHIVAAALCYFIGKSTQYVFLIHSWQILMLLLAVFSIIRFIVHLALLLNKKEI